MPGWEQNKRLVKPGKDDPSMKPHYLDTWLCVNAGSWWAHVIFSRFGSIRKLEPSAGWISSAGLGQADSWFYSGYTPFVCVCVCVGAGGESSVEAGGSAETVPWWDLWDRTAALVPRVKVALERLSGLELGSFCNIILKYTQPLFPVNNNKWWCSVWRSSEWNVLSWTLCEVLSGMMQFDPTNSCVRKVWLVHVCVKQLKVRNV